MPFKLIYITTPTVDSATEIAEALLREGLIACANILPGMLSMYEWEGKLRKEPEALLLCKSTSYMVPRIVERVRALHPHEVPCVTSVPIFGGNPDYLSWVGRTCVAHKPDGVSPALKV
ncbi:MAG: divalent-cation tolerance protein CutA [Bacteroidetes bacterium]|jgi:periplasmic divalent cation tolerance protein|nr:divalent-cation tolerance protein CutA [Bacteroidota bacterium]